MLSGISPTKTPLGVFAPPSMTNPNSVKKYVENFSDEEQRPVREHLGENLKKMIYVKHLEEMLELYDIYDQEAEKGIVKKAEKLAHSSEAKSYVSLFFSTLAVSGYLFRKKASLLQFESYFKNIYAVTGIFGFAYTFTNFWFSLAKNKQMQDFLKYEEIQSARNQMHSEAVNLTNELRFSINEAI